MFLSDKPLNGHVSDPFHLCRMGSSHAQDYTCRSVYNWDDYCKLFILLQTTACSSPGSKVTVIMQIKRKIQF